MIDPFFEAMSGGAVFVNLPLLFAIGFASGKANGGRPRWPPPPGIWCRSG